MTKEEFIKFIQGFKEWTFAKTYTKTHPHEYIALDKVGHEYKKQFVDAAKFIQEQGYKEPFYSTMVTYYAFGGYKYWTMDEDLEKTDLINRVEI